MFADKTSMKIARRARSFKDDFLDRINSIRHSPGGSVRTSSPTKRTKTSPPGGVAFVDTNVQKLAKDDKVL